MIAAQHLYQLRRDPLGKYRRNLGSDPDDFDMLDLPESFQEPLQTHIPQG